MRCSVIIPALDEAESISAVLEKIPPELAGEVIVVDGGSTDNTADIARARGARVLIDHRRGYGRACAVGAAAAVEEVLVFLDADGSDDPRQLGSLLEPLASGRADLVLGTRLQGSVLPGAMPRHQELGNRLGAWLLRRLYRTSLTDLSPFRALFRRDLPELEMREMTYGWPTEMIVKALLRRWRIVETPIIYAPRTGGRSKISGTLKGTLLSSWHILGTILRHAASR